MKTKTNIKAVKVAVVVDNRTEEQKQLDREEAVTRREVRIVEELKHYVEAGLDARKQFAAKLLREGDFIDLLADQVKWGYGVKEDLRASCAARALKGISDGHSVLDVLTWIHDDLTNGLLQTWDTPTSTNLYSNAVCVDKVEVMREMREKLRSWIERLSDVIAEAAVL